MYPPAAPVMMNHISEPISPLLIIMWFAGNDVGLSILASIEMNLGSTRPEERRHSPVRYIRPAQHTRCRLHGRAEDCSLTLEHRHVVDEAARSSNVQDSVLALRLPRLFPPCHEFVVLYRATCPPARILKLVPPAAGHRYKTEHALMRRKIFVGGIGPLGEREIADFFSKFGTVESCEVLRGRDKQPRGFSFVIFQKAETVAKLVATRFFEIGNRPVEVRHSVRLAVVAAV
eukprot:COSAG01_NODE_4584_length_4898_cov_18.985622_4_plen_231_part_00